ncbi:G-type lectin S-receptor-like serine/threonine-protein kinase At4g27290 [Castanea sativa]|uniref:G-type lectin S-receptor-like serine/threonine-protein kinase At4g27290 n=1 Tax=Castanea sativa TaxID=21020 RepID=UPI003F653727
MRSMRQPMQVSFVLYFLCCIFPIFVITTAVDTIVVTQSIRDGQTLVSSGGNFELGFFSPGNSKSRYIGIWYKKISTMTVIWVANRETPLNNTTGAFKLVDHGILVLMDEANNAIWSSNSSRAASNPVAQLLDTGNFIVRDGNGDAENIIWQSFDHPTDTFLPGMKYGFNLVTGLSLVLTSWKCPDDPSGGDYTNQLDPNGLPQFFLREGPTVLSRTGPWNGLHFSGMPNLRPNPIYKFQFVSNPVETYYSYQLINDSVVSRMVLNPDGKLQRLIWIDRTQSWSLYLTAQVDGCDRYARCGAYGSCNIHNSPACECLTGFVPKFPKNWNEADWSHGCVPKTPLNCGAGEGFQKYSGIKLPDTRQSWYNRTMDLDECRDVCLKNCTCTAYSSLDITGGGSGCILWFGELIDIRVYTEYGQDIYIRMAASELAAYGSLKRKKQTRIIVIALLSFGMALLGLCLMLYVSKKKPKREGIILHNPGSIQDFTTGSENDDLELPLFRFATIAYATDNFSVKNVLGKGGFGQVYKGILTEGQENKEIAVKRLSTDSRQGLHEFKNEVLSISKLQHRNLVKILGCCIQEEERMLIYEYMPNKSLDYFIFDPNQSILLDWPKCFHIINGIARGLLYLHQDSRLRIIHRDLKASNILLDYEMNPKIADFGMARIFGGDETEAKTSRVVGTYGYMPPEYAIDGLFSVKSDVYSFGVLVLEIVSGKRNREFSHPDHSLNLLGHAWRLYKEDRQLELIDNSEKESCNPNEVLRSIHVGLLCVQQCPEYRPTMSTVVLMLSSETALPEPREPGFHTGRYLSEMDSSQIKQEGSSTNGLTITLLEAR